MSACPTDDRLRALLDGRLAPSDTAAVEDHVNACDRCQDRLAGLVEALPAPRPDSGAEWRPTPTLLHRIRLAGSTLSPSGDPPAEHAAELPTVPGYTIARRVGSGGMGVVYEAWHHALGRRVALKMIRGAADEQVTARFRVEAEAVARLQHPNIVQIFEAGTAGGRPYLVLEFVEGGTLADRIADRPLPPVEAAELVGIVARAVHHAHQAGVVHRDLKPANILMAGVKRQGTGDKRRETGDTDQPPDEHTSSQHPVARPLSTTVVSPGAGLPTPKITDFGLARRVDDTAGLTVAGQVMGTPGYMAPEQAQAGAAAVGTAADVYSLGAVLYAALTGHPPFAGSSPADVLVQVLTEDPVPPRRFVPRLPRDLETVCLKCLEKDPRRRYATALDLAEDLRRFAAGESVLARPASPAAKVVKWARRQPLAASLLVLAVALGAGGLGGILSQWWRADRALVGERAARADERDQRVIAQKEAADKLRALGEAEQSLYLLRIDQAGRLFRDGALDAAAQVLDECPPPLRQWEWNHLRRQCRSAWVGIDVPTIVHAAATTPDGGQLASLSYPLALQGTKVPRQVHLWNPAGGPAVRVWTAEVGRPFGIIYLAGGTRVAVTADAPALTVWDAQSGAVVHTTAAHPGPGPVSTSVAYDPTAPLPTLLAAAYPDGTVRLLDPVTGDVRDEWTNPVRNPEVVLSRDGRLAAVFSAADGLVRVQDVGEKKVLHTLPTRATGVAQAAFDPTGRWLGTAAPSGRVAVWNVRTGDLAHLLGDDSAAASALAFSPDGEWVAAGNARGAVRVWATADGHAAQPSVRHAGRVRGLLFLPDGRLVSHETPKGMRVTPGTTRRPAGVAASPAASAAQIAWHPSGDRAAVVTPSAVRLVRLADGQLLPTKFETRPDRLTRAVTFDSTGRWLAADVGERLLVWDVADGRVVVTLPLTRAVLSLRFLPDGGLAAVEGYETAQVWEVPSGNLRYQTTRPRTGPGPVMHAWLPDGRRRAWVRTVLTPTATEGKIWDEAENRHAGEFRLPTLPTPGLAFVDAHRLAIPGRDGTIALWDQVTGEKVRTFAGTLGPSTLLAVSPDGRRLAAAGAAVLRLWDVESGRELLALPWEGANAASFSPDGRWIAVMTEAGVSFLDGRPGE